MTCPPSDHSFHPDHTQFKGLHTAPRPPMPMCVPSCILPDQPIHRSPQIVHAIKPADAPLFIGWRPRLLSATHVHTHRSEPAQTSTACPQASCPNHLVCAIRIHYTQSIRQLGSAIVPNTPEKIHTKGRFIHRAAQHGCRRFEPGRTLLATRQEHGRDRCSRGAAVVVAVAATWDAGGLQ